MITTLIIGKQSNLSQHLSSKISHSVLISSREIENNIELLSKYKNIKINIIFNNFQSSTQLNTLQSCSTYVINTVLITSMVLDYFISTDINKIIYTSSSSVYGNNICCAEEDEVKPLNLHAALKIANEKLIEKYAEENNIDFTITRIFNMYGGNDEFSVVHKILNAVIHKKEMTIVNHGNAIRDFIHIDDVVNIYVSLLNTKVKILNIGTGRGISIKSLLDFLHYRGSDVQVKNVDRDELKVSTANIALLNALMGKMLFIELEEYLNKELNL